MKTLFVLQSVLFPKRGIYQPEEMYYHSSGKLDIKADAIHLRYNDYVLTDSYFNVFDTDFWRKHTTLSTLGVRVRCCGRFRFRIYLSTNPKNSKEKCIWEDYLEQSNDEWFNLLADLTLNELRGMLSLEIICLSTKGKFFGGEFYTNDGPTQSARIAMVVCTYKREKYVLSNVKQWVTELFEEPTWKPRFELFLVDNGGTLSEQPSSGVHLYQNTNSGGAGGFTRGMIEALKGDFTHILLMDDDLTLHTGILKRAWAMCSFLKEKCCLSAAMLNYDECMCIQHERGGLLVDGAPGRGMNIPLGEGVDIRSFESVFWNRPAGFVYGAWWWYCVPTTAWTKDSINFAFPFFVRGDDIEFNLRLVERGYRNLFPTGFAVWHEPFFQKYSPAMEYLIVRNQFILSALHHLSYGSTRVFARHLGQLIFSCHYETAQVTLAGIRDFLKGPEVIRNHAPLYPLSFSKFIRDEKTRPLGTKAVPFRHSDLKPESRLHHLIRIMTLNGLLLPYAHQEVAAFLSEHRGPKARDTYRNRRVTYVREIAGEYYTVTSSRSKSIALLLQTCWVLLRLKLCRDRATKQWRDVAQYLEDSTFWSDYLGIR